MKKLKLVYLCSLRNAAADKAGRMINYKNEQRYMKSPLEHLVEQLNSTTLGDIYQLTSVIYDDDLSHEPDSFKLSDYGISRSASNNSWIYPESLSVQGVKVDDLLCSVPSSYRKFAKHTQSWRGGKQAFEIKLQSKFDQLKADLVLVDGLLVILDTLACSTNPYWKKIVNIHPGITRVDSQYQRRGATATLDALYGAQGKKVNDWQTMSLVNVPVINKTGASLHYVDQGIDSGPVVADVLETNITPDDSIYELRWNNFQQSLFPAMVDGLTKLAHTLLSQEELTEKA